ncbi:hypothetical protein SPRG_12792 [Saprolegnia parasitica CBS 223.65]|uniref:Uncharacterized protein n=1 Tax=Saprolegnia parasitica (strain CBS 223.65) TaxID=695850 RepID=A0A067C713_SAPPC|nr:hypothetical protein SPRG_12792 [Saprolegnia parasitica CBS 223.65]KDO22331.1 hypothetical protein SPRG_12792 [Saprolegnia parasitica CBS 223.65]|eukprot:XP_012206965.1 hypothetical protein SPRG_12792 [Saprolegnia parasitica CBS 223.65]
MRAATATTKHDRRFTKKATAYAAIKEQPVTLSRRHYHRDRPARRAPEPRALLCDDEHEPQRRCQRELLHDGAAVGALLNVLPQQDGGKAKKLPKPMGAAHATERNDCFVMVSEAAASCLALEKRWMDHEVDAFLASKNVPQGAPVPAGLLTKLREFLERKGYAIDSATYLKTIAIGPRSKNITDDVRRVCLTGVFHVTTVEQNYEANDGTTAPGTTAMQHMTCINSPIPGKTLFFDPDVNGSGKWRDLQHLWFAPGTVLRNIRRVIRARAVVNLSRARVLRVVPPKQH